MKGGFLSPQLPVPSDNGLLACVHSVSDLRVRVSDGLAHPCVHPLSHRFSHRIRADPRKEGLEEAD